MRIVRGLFTLLGCLAAASFLAQLIGLGVLWKFGALRREKRERLAAVLYGFDVSLWRQKRTTSPAAPEETPESRLARRVREASSLPDREKMLSALAASEHELTEVLFSRHTRDTALRQSLRMFLDETEQRLDRQALADLRGTLEVLGPKQAKQMVLQWFENRPSDLVAVIKEMPLERTKKIFAEFKTPAEAEQLHQIMLELGDLLPEQPEGESP